MNEYGLIKIFNELYVGFNLRSRTELIDDTKGRVASNYKHIYYTLAFLTPYETNTAGLKRQSTVNSWAGAVEVETEYDEVTRTHKRIVNEKPPERQTRVIKNEPLPGFKLAEEVRRTYWGGGNVVWRIEDPRGFEFEISSANLARIITECGISAGGVIEGKCIFGRLGKDNILIPEGSDLWIRSYKDAEELERKSKSVAKNLVDIGTLCEMKNGDMATYLGQFYVTELVAPEFNRQYERSYNAQQTAIVESENCSVKTGQYHAFKKSVSTSTYDKDTVFLYRDKRVVRVISQNDEFSDVEANREYLNSCKAEIHYASSSKASWNIKALAFTHTKPASTEFVARPVVIENLKTMIKYDRDGSLYMQSGTKTYGSEIVVVDTVNNGSLSSINAIYELKTITNAQGYSEQVINEDVSPTVVYGLFYRIVGNALNISITALERDGATCMTPRNYFNASKHLTDIKSVRSFNCRFKRHVDAKLETQQFNQLFFKVDDTCVVISE